MSAQLLEKKMEQFKVEVTRITKGIKEQQKYEKLYDDKHPKILANPDESQYGYVTKVLPFEDKEVIFSELVSEIDLNRIIRAVNKDI